MASTPAYPVAGGYRGQFNNDDQGHADFCVRLTVPAAALRYPDGSPSGFVLTPEILVPVQSNGVSCPDTAMARLDAREIVIGTDGLPMLFHRGGWGAWLYGWIVARHWHAGDAEVVAHLR